MSNLFRYPPDAYTPLSIRVLKSITEKEARTEYSRLRSVANKRIKRLINANYKVETNYFDKLSEIHDVKTLEYALSNVRLFLKSPESTIRGRKYSKSNRIATRLQERGFNITSVDVPKLGKFIDWSMDRLQGISLDSDQIVEMFAEYRDSGKSLRQMEKDFELWLKSYYYGEGNE